MESLSVKEGPERRGKGVGGSGETETKEIKKGCNVKSREKWREKQRNGDKRLRNEQTKRDVQRQRDQNGD